MTVIMLTTTDDKAVQLQVIAKKTNLVVAKRDDLYMLR